MIFYLFILCITFFVVRVIKFHFEMQATIYQTIDGNGSHRLFKPCKVILSWGHIFVLFWKNDFCSDKIHWMHLFTCRAISNCPIPLKKNTLILKIYCRENKLGMKLTAAVFSSQKKNFKWFWNYYQILCVVLNLIKFVSK